MNSPRPATAAAPADALPPDGYRAALRRLAGAQKTAKGGPAYSIWVNRRLGRMGAAAAYVAGLTPNQVTVISAAASASGVTVIAVSSPSWSAGVVAALLLAIGYALDASDGQLARLRGGGSLSGEWLDHVIDSVKITALHLAVVIHLYRAEEVGEEWLLVPLGYAVVAVCLFFVQLLNEQLQKNRRASEPAPVVVPAAERVSRIRAAVKLPLDYGTLCWSVVLIGAPAAFVTVYGLLFACNLGYLVVALPRWFRRMRSLDAGVAR